MRFVARLAIAIATVTSSALLCWGQPPNDRFGDSSATEQSGYFQGTELQPSRLPPATVDGAWVSDEPSPPSPPSPPTAPGERPFSLSEPQSMPGAPGADGALASDCPDEADCLSGAPAVASCLLGKHPFTDLWTEVHSHRRSWVQVDYLSWWAKGNQLPPLVTTSPLGTPQDMAGVLPDGPNTATLFGGNRVDLNQRNGARINFGYWLVDGEFLGVEGQYFALQQQNTLFAASSTFVQGMPATDQILARPFFNVDPNLPQPREDASLVAFPYPFNLANSQGALSGSVNVKTSSNVQGGNADFRRLIWIDFTTQRRVDLLVGYRFFRTDDGVTINDQSTFVGTSGPIGQAMFASQDVFGAKNQFNGGEIGLKSQSYHGPLSLELIGKVAFGNNRETMYINGANSFTTLGTTVVNQGGLLTQPSNIGTYRRDVFAILPEANANLRFDLTHNLRATLGYTFIYMNRVQRSGDAIDRTLNPTQINGGTLIGDARPAFAFHDTSFWVHGVNAGFEYRW